LIKIYNIDPSSTTKKIKIAGESKDENAEYIEIPVWNGTVANLTLMALGSSAPEILLSIIEIVGNNFESGELGPGTIVGSAAFNLLAISAVCVIGVPKGETRRIDQVQFFSAGPNPADPEGSFFKGRRQLSQAPPLCWCEYAN
jgi:solute carrier family 8 (sodium/calcium exchanger)